MYKLYILNRLRVLIDSTYCTNCKYYTECTDFTNHTDYADCMDFSYCQAQLQPQLQLSWADIATPNLQSIVDHKQ